MSKKITNNPYFHFLFFALIFAFGLSVNFLKGSYLLGGDGDYHLKYSALLRYGFSWNNDGLGLPVYGGGGIFPIIFILSFLEKFIPSIAAIKFILYFSVYLVTFLSSYLVCRALKLVPSSSFLMALFYVANPFSLIYFTSLNPSLTIVPATMMFFFWIILKFYHDNARLFCYFGLISLFFAFANLNPPLSAIIQISLLISVNVVSYYLEERYLLKKVAKKYLLIIISFFLFNFWWITNWFSFFYSDVNSQVYTKAFAFAFLRHVINSAGIIIPRILTFTAYTPLGTDLNFFGFYYNSFPSRLITLIPIIMVVYFLLNNRSGTRQRRLLLAIFLTSLSVLFLAKGDSDPFGFIYRLLFKYFPIFYIFKGPVEKFGLLFVFTFSLLLFFVMKEANQVKKFLSFPFVLTLYLTFCLVPVLTRNLFPDSFFDNVDGYMTGENYESRIYRENPGEGEIRKEIDKDILDYRVLGLPASRDYSAVTFRSFGNRFYSGVDPILANTSKPFLTFDEKTGPLYQNISSEAYPKLLGLFNIKKILLNQQLVPRYGFAEEEEIDEIKEAIDKSFISTYNK